MLRLSLAQGCEPIIFLGSEAILNHNSEFLFGIGNSDRKSTVLDVSGIPWAGPGVGAQNII